MLRVTVWTRKRVLAEQVMASKHEHRGIQETRQPIEGGRREEKGRNESEEVVQEEETDTHKR